MIFYITFLKALAACLITNQHYSDVNPSLPIDGAGAIGNLLFFVVSGYCLYNVKGSFLQWYGKRVWRIWPSVIIITVAYTILGYYKITGFAPTLREFFLSVLGYHRMGKGTFIWQYLYPSNYHFIGSIIALYIPFYFFMKIKTTRERIIPTAIVLGLLALTYFFTFYDRSYNHIPDIREPFIRWVFMEGMLIGAWFRQNDEKTRNRFKIVYPIMFLAFVALLVAYRFARTRYPVLVEYQIVTPLCYLGAVFYLMKTFAGLDSKLEKLPAAVKKGIEFVATLTLEIYIVQMYLIHLCGPRFAFPLNWFVTTAAILIAAYLLKQTCNLFYKATDKTVALVKRRAS